LTLKAKSESFRTCSEQVKNGPFERGCRWFQLFFIDFQFFYFLTRIIRVLTKLCNICHTTRNGFKSIRVHGAFFLCHAETILRAYKYMVHCFLTLSCTGYSLSVVWKKWSVHIIVQNPFQEEIIIRFAFKSCNYNFIFTLSKPDKYF
jgi:hypothetical protein